MTIGEALNTHPNINFRYTKTNIPVVDDMPEGYRWADEVEVEYWWHIEGAVQVCRGANKTDIAVPINNS